jgi:hypothetical protein
MRDVVGESTLEDRAVTAAHRQRLTMLIVAGTQLDTAARLVKEAAIDLASSNFQRQRVQKIATEIDLLLESIAFAIEEIPST